MSTSENKNDSLNKSKRKISLPKKLSFTLANNNLKNKSLINFNNFSFDNTSTTYNTNLSFMVNKNLTEKCWNILSDIIIKNYRLRKGTYIENFGTFTLFSNSVEGDINNNYIPIFILDNKFNINLKPGFYSPHNGLILYDESDFYPNNIRILNIDFEKINVDYNIPKEKFNKALMSILNDMNDKIINYIFANKKMGNLGVFLLRGNIFGMRFNNYLFDILETPKKFTLYRSFNTVKNNNFDYDFGLTNNNSCKLNVGKLAYPKKQNNYKNLKNNCFSESERFYKPNNYIITEVNESNDDNDLNKKFNRKFKFVRLKKIGLSKENIEIIYNNKEKIIDNLKKNCDNYYRDYINKNKCEEIFLEINKNLTSDNINDIINIYSYDEDDEDNNSKRLLNLMNYKKIINNLFPDMNIILNREKKLEIPKNNITNNIFKKKEFCENEEEDVHLLSSNYENNLYKLKNALYSILNLKCGLYKIYYNELISHMKQKNNSNLIDILNEILQKLNVTDLKSENLIVNMNTVIQKIEKILKDNVTKRLHKSYDQICNIMKNQNNVLGILPHKLYVYNKRYTNYDYLSKNDNNNIINKIIPKNKITNSENNKNSFSGANNNANDEELIIRSINKIKSKIEKNGESTDKIAEYFDHILSYNFPRRENVIYYENFIEINNRENYNFTPQEIEKVFKFFDKNNNNYIDRKSFIEEIKKVHYPITSIKKYIKENNLTVFDIAYKMQIYLYKIPFNELSNLPITKTVFYSNMKSLNGIFSKTYLYSLYDALLAKNENNLNNKKLLEEFDIVKNQYNIKNNYTYENIFENSEKIKSEFVNSIYDQLTYNEIRQKLVDVDPQSNGTLSLNIFISIFEKINIIKENLLHFLRMHDLIDIKRNIVEYIHFLEYMLKYEKKNLFALCLKILVEFLENQCNKELFIFCTKINGMNNNSGINEKINPEKFLAFFKCKLEDANIETAMKFDYDKDKFISLDDIKNIVEIYHDKDFFEQDKNKNIKNEILLSQNNLFNENKKFYINLLQILKKNNLPKEKFFNFLDSNKDTYIDRKEFHKQLLSMPNFISFMNHNYIITDTELNLNYNTINEKLITSIDNFFDFLDEFKSNKIELNTFLNRLHYLEITLNLREEENNPRFIFILEELLFDEFCNWIKNNCAEMPPSEIFAVLDHDHDGMLEISDLRYFFNTYLMIPMFELQDEKLDNFKKIISITNDNNITSVDLQNLLKNLKDKKNQNIYKNNIINYCLKGNFENKIKYITKDIAAHINKKYCNDINKAFNEYNNNFVYGKKDEGISYENFKNFIKDNRSIFECYHLTNKDFKEIFNYISNNKKYICFNEFKNLFHNNINNTDNKVSTEKINDTDFYGNMHLTIKNYLNENFNSSEDSFKYFKDKNVHNLNYITIKEFFNGINNLFPKKYETNTILNYFQITFKKNITSNENKEHDKLNTITFNEFKEKYYPNDLNNKPKKLFLPSTYYSTQYNLDLKSSFSNNKTSFSKTPNKTFISLRKPLINNTVTVDPLEKLKRMISFTDKEEKLKIVDDFINKSANGTITKYEFYNLAKKLKLRLSNIEIEQITQNKKFFNDGCVNLLNLKDYLSNDKFIMITKKNLDAQFSEIKQLIIKYYSNPRLAFELNTENEHHLSFSQFKNILYYLYSNEKRQMPLYPVIKSLFDFIDYKMDGKIDSEEWSTIFSKTEGSLDKKGNSEKKIKDLRNWEVTDDVIKIYKLIAKNRKIIKEKFKLFSVDNNCLLIHSKDLINILKEVLFGIELNNNQWKLITSIGKKGRSGFVDFQTFINVIEIASKI